MRRVCALSVDVDPIACYTRIHGLGEPSEALREVIERRALQDIQEPAVESGHGDAGLRDEHGFIQAARLWQQVRRIRHRFHSARHDDFI